MAAQKNPLADKAYELYKQGIPLVEIANQLEKPAGTIRRWKSTYGWDSERSDKKSERSGKKRANTAEERTWIEIENEYVTDIRKKPCSLESLSKKHGIPIDTLKDRCSRDGWVSKRAEYTQQTLRKAKERSSDRDADRIVRLLQLADVAADKAEQSLNELETYVVKNKRKVKDVVLHDVWGKPIKETIDEKEEIVTTSGPVDRQGLLFITNALKNLKEIQLTPMGMGDMEHKHELDRQKMELELLKVKGEENTEYESDGFIDALQEDMKETFKDVGDIVET